jgi:membrane protein YqaA with SNARE-associated domain
MKRLYQWTVHWAETPYGLMALALLAFAESSFFPIPPDVLLIALVMLRSSDWRRFALVCTLASVTGGFFGYWIGHAIWETVKGFFFAHVFSESAFLKVEQLYHQYDFWAVLAAAFTPIPYKVFTIAAGVFDLKLLPFGMASVLGRGGRFFLVAGILSVFGTRMKPFIEKYFNLLSILFFILLIGGFVLMKWLAEN